MPTTIVLDTFRHALDALVKGFHSFGHVWTRHFLGPVWARQTLVGHIRTWFVWLWVLLETVRSWFARVWRRFNTDVLGTFEHAPCYGHAAMRF